MEDNYRDSNPPKVEQTEKKVAFFNFSVCIILLLSLLFMLFRINGIDFGLWYGVTYHPDEKWYRALPVVFENDFNPHYFLHPPFYVYLLGLFYKFLLILMKLTFQNLPLETIRFVFVLSGRFLSACFSLATVWFMMKIAADIGFKERERLAFFATLCFSPLCIVSAHYTTPDSALTCFAAMTMFFLIRSYEKEGRFFVFFTFFLIGISTALKYNALFLVFSAFLMLVFRKERKSSLFLFGVLFLTAGFFAGSPYALIDFPSFFEGILHEINFRTDILTPAAPSSFSLKGLIDFTSYLSDWYGFPFLLFYLLSFGVLFWKRDHRKLILIASFPFFYLLITSPLRNLHARDLLPILPFLLLLCCVTCFSIKKRFLKVIAFLLFLYFPFMNSLEVKRSFDRIDTRSRAVEWIQRNIPKHEKIAQQNHSRFNPPIHKTGFDFFSNVNFSPEDGKSISEVGIRTRTGEYFGKKTYVFPRGYFSYYITSVFPNTEFIHYKNQALDGTNGLQGFRLLKTFRHDPAFGFMNPTIRIYRITAEKNLVQIPDTAPRL